MLPILPFVVAGAIGTGVGIALKKFYDDNEDEIHKSIEDGLTSIDEWFDEKLVALDDYKDSLDDDVVSTTINTQTKNYIQALQKMKKDVYYDSFTSFINFYKKLDNVDLGKLDFIQLDFPTLETNENIDDDIIKHNTKITTDLLFKANNILSDIVENLNTTLKDNFNYESFSLQEKKVIKEAFSLAKFIQKICMSEDLEEDVVVKFNNIISDVEESN